MVVGCYFLLKHGKSEFRARYSHPSAAADGASPTSSLNDGAEVGLFPKSSEAYTLEGGGGSAVVGNNSSSSDGGAGVGGDDVLVSAAVVTRQTKQHDHNAPPTILQTKQPFTPPQKQQKQLQEEIRTPLLDVGSR
jgi:hypothetical protein